MTDIELAKLRAEALDTRHLKLAIWGTEEQLVSVLRNKQKDPFHTDQRWLYLADREYPKIETLWNRDDKRFVIPGNLRRPEFGIIKSWSLTEKLNGRNLRVTLSDNETVEYLGRSDEAELTPEILKFLMEKFPLDNLKKALWLPGKTPPQYAAIYGEGYGPHMAAGSGIYCKDRSFRLFDCLMESPNGVWWLERSNIEDIARKLDVRCVPVIGHIDYLPVCAEQLQDLINESIVAREENCTGMMPEGIVAKSEPLVYDRKGDRIMWKLKMKDFKKIKRAKIFKCVGSMSLKTNWRDFKK